MSDNPVQLGVSTKHDVELLTKLVQSEKKLESIRIKIDESTEEDMLQKIAEQIMPAVNSDCKFILCVVVPLRGDTVNRLRLDHYLPKIPITALVIESDDTESDDSVTTQLTANAFPLAILSACTQIKLLIVRQCDLSQVDLHLFHDAAVKLPIEFLMCLHCRMQPTQQVQFARLLRDLPNLRSLAFQHDSEPGRLQLLGALESCTKLRALELYMPPECTQEECQCIAKAIGVMRDLEDLTLFESSGALIATVCRALTTLPRLKSISFIFNDFTFFNFPVRAAPTVQDADAVRELVVENEAVRIQLPRDFRLGLVAAERLPPEVAALDNDAIIAYWRSLSKSARTVHRMKLMLVGYGQVGKTCLLRSLKNEPQPESSQFTDGIDISEWEFACKGQGEGEDETPVTLSCWDFAGQEAYYATHQLFLSKRCLYLLVWNPRLKDAKSGVEYWLKSIQMYAENADVFLVATRKDEQADIDLDVLDPDDLRESFPKMKLSFYHISNIASYHDVDNGIAKLRQAVYATSMKLGRIELAESWLKFANNLVAERSKYRCVLHTSQVAQWAEEHKIEGAARKSAIKTLHNWGTLLRYRLSKLNDVCVLEPHWLSDVARSLVTAKETSIKHAVVSIDDLMAVWRDKVKDEDYLKLLQLMYKFELAFELEDERQLVPALLKEKPSGADVRGLNQLLNSYPHLRMHRFELSFVPANLMIRVIFRTHKFTVKHAANVHSCWKNYVALMKNEQLATIQLEGMQLTITVAGSAPNNMCSLLADMVGDVIKRYPNIKPDQTIACPHCKKIWLPVTAFSNSDRDDKTCNNCSKRLDLKDLIQCIGFNTLDSMQIPSGPSESDTTLLKLHELIQQLQQQQQHDSQQIKEMLLQLQGFIEQFDGKIDEFQRLFHQHSVNLLGPGQAVADLEQRQQFERSALNLLHTIDKRTCAHMRQTWQSDKYHTPRIVYLLPHEHKSWRGVVNPKNLIRDKFDLHLMCELPGRMHNLKSKPYVVEMYKESWKKIAPILIYGLMVARIALAAVPVVGAGSLDIGLDAAVTMIEEMAGSAAVVPHGLTQQASSSSSSLTPLKSFIEQQGVALREFSAWMLKIDPLQTFQQLEQVSLPSGEVCWLCADHAREVRTAKVDQNVSLPVPIASGSMAASSN